MSARMMFHACGAWHDARPWDKVPTRAERAKMSPARRAIWKRIDEQIAEEKACPNFAAHNDRELGMPDGYSAREEWWRVTLKTHTQHYCEGCSRWTVWRARR